jgi:hypothetical protein
MIRIAMVATMIVSGLTSVALAKSIRWKCTYSIYASPDGLKKDDFDLEFLLDDVTGKAVLVGNYGLADVAVHTGPSGLTFMETVPSGVVQTTTIAKDGASVHSRHSIGPNSKLWPSQYYGRCK